MASFEKSFGVRTERAQLDFSACSLWWEGGGGALAELRHAEQLLVIFMLATMMKHALTFQYTKC